MGTPRGEWMLRQTPMARFGDAHEITGQSHSVICEVNSVLWCAGAVLYLAGPSASFTTGVVLPVDGGFLARGTGA